MNLGLEIYNLVVQVIGTLPLELTWVYGFCVILVFCFIFFFISIPFVLIYKGISRW